MYFVLVGSPCYHTLWPVCLNKGKNMHIDQSVNLSVRGMVVNKDKHSIHTVPEETVSKFLACLHILMPAQILCKLVYLSLVYIC